MWTPESLLQRVEQYVFNQDEFSPNFFLAISKNEDSVLELTEEEYVWLQYNCEFLKIITQNKLASSIMYHFIRSNSTTVRGLADRMGIFDSNISYWFKKLMKYQLITTSKSSIDGRLIYFHKSTKLKNIMWLLERLILKQYAESDIMKNLVSGASKGSKSRVSVRMARRKHYYRHLPPVENKSNQS